MSARFTLPLVTLLLAFAACSGPSKATRDGQSNVANGGGALDDEARREAANYLNRRFLTCGEYMVMGSGGNSGMGMTGDTPGSFMMIKGGRFTVKRQPLSDTDKLNGVQWKGQSLLYFTAYREFVRGQGWGAWREYNNDGPSLQSFYGFDQEVRKVNGVWDFAHDPLGRQYQNGIHSCSEVPQ